MIIQAGFDIIALITEQGGVYVPDYKEMYLTLFRSTTQAINLLQEAQRQTEEMYISADPPDIRVINLSKPDSDESPENE